MREPADSLAVVAGPRPRDRQSVRPPLERRAPRSGRPAADLELRALAHAMARATGSNVDHCQAHLEARTRPLNPLVAAVWEAEMCRHGVTPPAPGARAPSKRFTRETAVKRALMQATGLSEEACRACLATGRLPQNPVVAAAWYEAMRRLGEPCTRPGPTRRPELPAGARPLDFLMHATALGAKACAGHLRKGTRPLNPILAAAWDAEMTRLGLSVPERPSRRRTARHTRSTSMKEALMKATGLSDEMCRQHLAAGTRPRNPIVAAAWDAEMRRLRRTTRSGAVRAVQAEK